MKLQIPGKYQSLVKWLNRSFAALGIILSFVVMPIMIAGAISVTLFIICYGLERIYFRYSMLYVSPMPSFDIINHRLGSLWSHIKYNGKDRILFGQVFDTKKAAKDAYKMFRQWNFSNYIDRNQNIVLSIIKEEQYRYSIFLYPGERGVSKFLRARVKAIWGSRAVAETATLISFFPTFVDYSNNHKVNAVIESLNASTPILLNTFYIKGERVLPYAKKHLMLRKVRVKNRDRLSSKEFENQVGWSDPYKELTENEVKAFKKLRDKALAN
ncbi:MAG: hypothetical protein J3T61_09265 [Candidatus Brocadiales bacterium]|nr:hypothetical protein [Candidatus Bathyanammoxibius sp.]